MASNLRPVPPPVQVPMLDKDGLVVPVWADFFEAIYRYEKAIASAAADGTYTLGSGTPDGTITMTGGIITAIQEVG